MNRSIAGDIEAWEDDGGRALPPPAVVAVTMVGAANQIEWAERIRRQVNEEFDRVARAFRSVGGKQNDALRADTAAIVAILEEKRAEVMSQDQAGYFIHNWQEMSGRVRQMIYDDPRYQAIKSSRLQRK